MVSFQGVVKNYNGHAVLKDIDFKIEPAEFVSLVGKSGAGKTTIIKLLTGEEKPSRGKIFFAREEVGRLKPQELPVLRRQIGVIFQDFRLLSAKNSYENVAFAMEVAGRPQAEIVEFVPQMLDMVGLAEKARNFPHELSGGEKQRVAIARAMINKPTLVIADEATGNLDPGNTWEIIRLLLKINELGTTVLLATHSKDIINHLGRRVITLDDGKIIRDEKNGRYILD